MDIAKTLAKCGLQFRGHDERKESINTGDFLEVVGLLNGIQSLLDTWRKLLETAHIHVMDEII